MTCSWVRGSRAASAYSPRRGRRRRSARLWSREVIRSSRVAQQWRPGRCPRCWRRSGNSPSLEAVGCRVGPAAAGAEIAARVALELVVATLPEDRVRPGAAAEVVLAQAAAEHVTAQASLHRVGAQSTLDQVGLGAADDAVAPGTTG